jgi:isopentenyl-diphosphate delta-isomerase
VRVDTRTRKERHLDACLHDAVESGRASGLADFRFDHAALPEIDLADVDPSVTLLGRRLAWPFLVGAMTGGTGRAGALNDVLARAAAASGCGIAMGSLRVAIEDPAALPTFDVRARVPDVPLLLGNIGASHAGAPFADRLPGLCARLRLDGLVVHVNPLQEALQAGGEVAWSGVADRIARLKERLAAEAGLPLGVKEVGSGWSPAAAQRLASIEPDFVEAAGVGGTSFAAVEGAIADDPLARRCAATFAAWGHDTASSIASLRDALPGTPIVASGGLRTGLDLAVALRLGATAGAMALPLLRAAEGGEEAVAGVLAAVRQELVLAAFLTGSRTVADLRRAMLRDRRGQPVLATA